MNRRATVCWIVLPTALWAATVRGEAWPSGREVIPLEARPFDLADVRLLDGPFKDAMHRTRKYLHALESDRLLYYFRETVRLDAPGKPMGGWEEREVRGHTMGHYLSACALMFASTGDAKLKAKADAIVSELARCQRTHQNGYLSAFPESFIDRVLARQRVWAPWYTLHKIYAGLVDMYVHCGSEQALEVAVKMAGWAQGRLDPLTRDQMQDVLNHTEQGGMNEVLANLYGLTGERRWLDLSRRFVQDRYVEPLARGEDRLKGEHVNSFIPNIIGTARQFELGGDQRDRRIAEYFWSQVVEARCYSTGGTSNREHWQSEPHELADQLDDHTQETCCTYNMLKLTRHLFAWEPSVKYADYYERALINSILATQDPESGMMMYFVTLAPGRWKYFNTPRDSFWCCTGTGLENHAKYADSIYFHNDSGVWVNLFIASELDWKQKGVVIRQETRFPEEEATSLTIETSEPTRLALRIRIPEWTQHGPGAKVRLNGTAVDEKVTPGSYLVLDRPWADGDRVDVELGMGLWTWPMPDDESLVTLMYGPLVLAGRLGGEGLTDELTYTTQNFYPFPQDEIAEAPAIVTESPEASDWVRPVAGEALTFRTAGVGRPRDVTLVPYHRLWRQRYAVYWRVLSEDAWQEREAERRAREAMEEAQRKAFEARLVDRVDVGRSGSEREHGLKGERTGDGVHLGRRWRHAPGGWFRYQMKVLPDAPVTLAVTYWGNDGGKRTFDVVVNDRIIATESLNRNEPGKFFVVEYDVPQQLTQGTETVQVTFRAHPGNTAGGVFGLATLRADQEQ